MNDSKYNYMEVRKPSVLLTEFLLNVMGDRFCLKRFSNFQNR